MRDGDALVVDLDGARLRAYVVEDHADLIVYLDGRAYRLTRLDPLAAGVSGVAADSHLRAPMSGTVVAVHVKSGDKVTKGAPLLILEAMKMEHIIAAPADGVVANVFYESGEQVAEGAELVTLE